MSKIRVLFLVLFASVNTSSFAQFKLEISGDVLTPLQLSLDDLKSFKEYSHTVTDRDGKLNEFRGVALIDLLAKAGVPTGRQLRGENVLKIVLITAGDGYQVAFSLAETDPEFSGKTILVATEKNGEALKTGEGPLRIIAPQDLAMARWIREVRSIRIVFPQE